MKLPLYAQAGIPEAWIVNLEKQCIDQYTQPSPHGYQQAAVVGLGQQITTQSIPDLTLAADDIFGASLA